MALEEEVLDEGFTEIKFDSVTTPNRVTLNGIEFTPGSFVPFEEYTITPEMFCAQHGQRLTGTANTEVTIGGISLGNILFPEQGQTIQLGSDPGATSTKSESLCKYDKVERRKAGVDGDWDIAYVLNQYPNNKDHQNGEVQNAYWAILGQAGMNELAQEAKAFQEYKERVQKAGGFKGEYKIDLSSVSFDTTKDEIIVGPVSFKYERGFAKVGNRPKVEFGGIKEIKLYDQDGDEIDKSIWKITYDAEHKDSKKERLPGDEDYGTTGSEFFSYPYSGEEFNIVLDASKCKEEKITKISKAEVTLYDLDIVVEYYHLSGEYRDVLWEVQVDTYTCTNQEKFVDIDGNETIIPCEHGYTTAHEQKVNFRLVASVVQLSPQELDVVIKSEMTPKEGKGPVTPNPPDLTTITPKKPSSAIPSIINTPSSDPTKPTTPTWPSWPDYPDWPDDDDDDDDDNDNPDDNDDDNPDDDNPGDNDNDNPDDDNPGDDDDGGNKTPPDEPDLSLTIRLSGVVWEDSQTGKESEYDGVIGYQNDGTQEKGIPKVKVTLYKAGTKELAEAKENPVYTNDEGEYYFTRVPMGKYEVDFEYDGMTYTSTKPFASGSVDDYKNNPDDTKYVKDSKAEETQADRQSFNNKFYEISGDSSTPNEDGKTYGTARDSAGNKTADLEYTTQDGVSKLVTTTEDGYVKPEFAMKVSTANMGLAFPFQERYTNNEEDKLIDNNVYEFFNAVLSGRMDSVTVGGFHDNHIGFLYDSRIP